LLIFLPLFLNQSLGTAKTLSVLDSLRLYLSSIRSPWGIRKAWMEKGINKPQGMKKSFVKFALSCKIVIPKSFSGSVYHARCKMALEKRCGACFYGSFSISQSLGKDGSSKISKERP